MLKKIKNIHYKVLFLYGSLYAYIAGMILTILLGTYTHHMLTVYVALFSGLVVSGVTYYFMRTQEYILTSIVLLWTSVFFVYFRIVNNGYSLDIAFLLIPSMVSAILLNKKHLIYFNLLYVLLTLSLLRYGYLTYLEHPFLHNKSLMIIFGIFSFFVVSFSFIYHYSIEQSYIKLEKSDRQKEILLKEVHHRVKNNLNMMTSILGLQMNKYHAKEIQDFIEQNTLRINSIALVHELLYKEENIEGTSLENYIDKLSEHILKISKKKEIVLNQHIEDIELNVDDIIHIGIIINELLTNSLKYAFKEDEGKIDIRLERMDNHYILKYTDNGCGMREENRYKEGFGFALISLSVEHLEGTLTFPKHTGFKCQIRFKGTQT